MLLLPRLPVPEIRGPTPAATVGFPDGQQKKPLPAPAQSNG